MRLCRRGRRRVRRHGLLLLLAGATLAAWGLATPAPPAAAGPNSSPTFIVSLTTTPLRLPLVDATLESLRRQSRPPARVLLHVPARSLRTGGAYAGAAGLRARLAGTDVDVVTGGGDDGPATKLLGALRRVPPGSDAWIVTVDDDIAYPPCALATLEHAVGELTPPRAAAVGLAGFRVPRWGGGLALALEPANRSVDVLEGYAGAAYHRSFFGADFEGYWATCATNRSCAFSDDVAISNYLALRGVGRRAVHYPACNLWRDFVRPSLRPAGPTGGRRVVLPHGTRADALYLGGGRAPRIRGARCVSTRRASATRWRRGSCRSGACGACRASNSSCDRLQRVPVKRTLHLCWARLVLGPTRASIS